MESTSGSSMSMSMYMDDTLTLPSTVTTVMSGNDSVVSRMSETDTPKNTKLNRFILTFFPPDDDILWLQPQTYFPNPKSLFQMWIGQFEICPQTGKLHAHVYVESIPTKRPRFSFVQSHMIAKLDRCNIKPAKHSSNLQRQCAINYVTCKKKRSNGTDVFKWIENLFDANYDPTCQIKEKETKKAQETEKQRVWIESKSRFWTWDQILHESEESKRLLATCSWGPKYHAGRHAEDKRRTISKVIILYGAGGTGKTTSVLSMDALPNENQDERYYRRNTEDGNFWGGGRTAYKGQRLVHYEEFTGQETFSRLKEVCDIGKVGPAVNIKNGGAQLNHESVVFTSNVHPAGWFHNLWNKDVKQFHPFWRRVTEVWFYPSHREDGSLNIPDSNNEPYRINQTQDWIDLGGDYKACCDHAENHWPLTVEEPNQAMLINLGKRDALYVNDFHTYCQTGKHPRY